MRTIKLSVLLLCFLGCVCFGDSLTVPGNLIVSSNVTTAGTVSAGAFTTIGLPSRIVVEGDSLSNDAGDWAGLMTTYIYPFNTWFVTNVATAGESLSNMVAEYTAQVQPFKPATGTNAVLFLWAGANGITEYGSALGWYSAWSNYMAQARSDGFKICAFTIMQKATDLSETTENYRFLINNWLRSSTNADWLIDADKMFPNATDQTYFNPDGIHLEWYNGTFKLALEVAHALSGSAGSWATYPVPLEQASTNFVIRNPVSGQKLASFNGDKSVVFYGAVTATAYSESQTALGNGTSQALDLTSNNRSWSCFPTGDVTFTISAATNGQNFKVFLLNTNATNITITFPASAVFNGYKPTYLTAGKQATWYGNPWTVSSTNRVVSAYGEEQ